MALYPRLAPAAGGVADVARPEPRDRAVGEGKFQRMLVTRRRIRLRGIPRLGERLRQEGSRHKMALAALARVALELAVVRGAAQVEGAAVVPRQRRLVRAERLPAVAWRTGPATERLRHAS
jgi:hypothetical protein